MSTPKTDLQMAKRPSKAAAGSIGKYPLSSLQASPRRSWQTISPSNSTIPQETTESISICSKSPLKSPTTQSS